MNVIGLDIGTTSICAAVFDAGSGESVDIRSFANSFSTPGKPFERCQDAEAIFEKCKSELDELIDRYSPVCAIGITGQMHGIVYIDKCAATVSRLFTWQDMSGEQLCAEGMSLSKKLSEITGYNAASGFGLTTYFVHKQTGCVPKNAACVCTIHDYTAMRLCGISRPVMHASDAASFGLFDTDKLCFDLGAIKKAGLDSALLPDVTDTHKIIGEYRSIPVCVAIGDNQASFIGSVSDMENSLLVNIGTGSQISCLASSKTPAAGTELRPCDGGRLIMVGSALCGGRAFAALEKFIRATMNLCGADVKSAYPFVDQYLAANLPPENPLAVSTRFAGTRDNPAERGKIENLSLDNFMPGHLIYGVLQGIADELRTMYLASGEHGKSILVGSGNGLRKNKALQRIFEEAFGCALQIPAHTEEAAFGAALYSLAGCGFCDTLADAQRLIKYQ